MFMPNSVNSEWEERDDDTTTNNNPNNPASVRNKEHTFVCLEFVNQSQANVRPSSHPLSS